MPFNWRRYAAVVCLLAACALGVALIVTGCSDKDTSESEVFVDAQDRVAENVLPEIADESNDVFRNLTNLLTALPQICATPIATLGSFTSALPALGQPQSVALVKDNEEDQEERIFRGSWKMVWNDVVLGSDGASPTDASPVDITLNVRPRTSGQSTLQAVPFTLVPQSALLATATAGQPAVPENVENFFRLFQDAATGVWTLSWQTLAPSMVFDGTITQTVFSRVIRRVSDIPSDIVESLEVASAANSIRFKETTTPEDTKGFTFFVRPGQQVKFELRIGTTDNDLQDIKADQLYIGSGAQQLPDGEDPGDFELATNLPMDSTGAPTFTPGQDLGMFIWQDIEQNDCNSGEDQWRVRFSTAGEQTKFHGDISAIEDDHHAELTFTVIGACQGNRKNGDKTLDYTCTLEGDQTGGYDICVTSGRRVSFDPEVNDLRDPGVVFVGAERQPPPSPDPFNIVFDIDLEEPQSSRHHLTLSDAQLVMSGNSDMDGVLRLNPDQVSLEPLCGRLPQEIEAIVRPQVAANFAPGEPLVQPAVTLSNDGDYATRRYDGSLYRLKTVEFLNSGLTTLDTAARFPGRGQIELETRVKGELENSTLTGEAEDISTDAAGHVTWPVDIDLNLSRVQFKFFDIPDAGDADRCADCIMDLTVE